MTRSGFKTRDFDHPSLIFRLEDKLNNALGSRFRYNPYYKTFKLIGDEKILDFGCGGGVGTRCLLKLLNKDGHVTGVDSSGYWIKKAQQRLKEFSNVDLMHGNIKELDIPNNSIDIITIIYVIHDIEPNKRQEVVKALFSRLKSGGVLHIKEPIRDAHGMPVSEIRNLMSNAGLKEVEHEIKKREYVGKFVK